MQERGRGSEGLERWDFECRTGRRKGLGFAMAPGEGSRLRGLGYRAAVGHHGEQGGTSLTQFMVFLGVRPLLRSSNYGLYFPGFPSLCSIKVRRS